MEDQVGRWLLEILLLLLCALLTMAQAALKNANESKLRAAAADGDERAKKLLPLLERPEPVIALRGLRTFFLLLFSALGVEMCRRAGLGFWPAALIFSLIAAMLIMSLGMHG